MAAMSYLTALAQVSPPAPESHEPQLLDIDGTVFVMLGLFLVTVLVLSKWLWKPYLRVREERVTRVEGFREEAARLETEATTRLARIDAQLAEVRRAGSAERARARSEAQAHEQTLISAAQASSQRALADAKAKLDAAFAAEQGKLQERAATLGREITEKVLDRPVAP